MTKIPTLRGDIRFSTFDEASSSNERYLVEAGESCFAVNRQMYHLLALLGEGPMSLEALTFRLSERIGQPLTVQSVTQLLESRIPPALRADHPDVRRRTPFLASVKLFSGNTIRPLTSRLTWIFNRYVVIAALLAFGIITAFTISAAAAAIHHPFSVKELVAIYALIAVIGLIHELGHATASHRYGCEHGDVGFGLYYLFPAFYADVTKAWRLSPTKRAVIDLGGLYFNALTLIPIGAFAALTGNRIALKLIWITLFMMLQNLNPIFKLDGYWLFSDLSGLTNLHERVWDAIARRRNAAITGLRRNLLNLYVAAVAVYAVFVVDFLVRSVRGVIATYPDRFAHASGAWEVVVASVWPIILGATLVSIAMKVIERIARMTRGLA